MPIARLPLYRGLYLLDCSGPNGRTFEDHLSNLQVVLDRLRQAGLRVKPTKCAILQERVNYLGHIMSKEGLETDPAKTEKV